MSKTTMKAKAKGDGAGERALIAALDARPDASVAELAAHAGLGRSTVSGLLAGLERRGEVTRTVGGRDGARRLPDRWSRPQRRRREPASRQSRRKTAGGRKSTAAAPRKAAETGSDRRSSEDRLPARALDGLVLGYMREHGDGPLGPGMIAKAIDKSAGAVANCLVRLARDEQVRQVSEQPIRYSLAA